MNKTDIINKVSERTEVTKKDTEKVVTAMLDIIVEALTEGQKVSFTGFGSFEAKERSARIGHNPKTGEKIQIPASKTVSFKAGKTFKDAVNA